MLREVKKCFEKNKAAIGEVPPGGVEAVRRFPPADCQEMS